MSKTKQFFTFQFYLPDLTAIVELLRRSRRLTWLFLFASNFSATTFFLFVLNKSKTKSKSMFVNEQNLRCSCCNKRKYQYPYRCPCCQPAYVSLQNDSIIKSNRNNNVNICVWNRISQINQNPENHHGKEQSIEPWFRQTNCEFEKLRFFFEDFHFHLSMNGIF